MNTILFAAYATTGLTMARTTSILTDNDRKKPYNINCNAALLLHSKPET
jgi:hypothetical protein